MAEPKVVEEVSWKRVAEVRFDLIYLVLCLLGLAVLGKILWIQWVDGAELRARGDLVYSEEVLEASRGNILSDDGRLLATSLPMFRLYMDLVPVQDTNRQRREAAMRFFESEVDSLGVYLHALFPERSGAAWSKELRKERGRGNRYYRLGSRDVSYSELQRVYGFPLFRAGRARSGLIVEEHYRRITPMGDLARRTVGWRSSDGSWSGIEDYFDSWLRGKPGRRVMQRAANNRRIPVSTQEHIPPSDGMDVESTLDVNLQDVASRALRRKLEEHQAEKGTVVVMEVATGAVKAMVNLSRGKSGVYHEQFNLAVGESSEPGSTFKLASLIALLEDGLIRLDDTIDTGSGVYRKHGYNFEDAKRGGHGKISVSQVWEYSSNAGIAQLLYTHYEGREHEFLDRIFSLRLNQPLGVTIRGEGQPYIRVPGERGWSGLSLGQIGRGYEVNLTPLQVLTFYNAIANDGCMVRPMFVRGLWRNGELVKEYKPVVLQRSVCSDRVLKSVRGVLERVVERGTATNLRTAHYRIAGKTGTSQRVQGHAGYQVGGRVEYQSSFVGYFPAESPRYSCIVVVYSPSSRGYYGNAVAGPIFREIADKVYATRREWFPRWEGAGEGIPLASKAGKGSALRDVFSILDYTVRDGSGGSYWVDTRRDEEGVVYLQARQYGMGVVPDVCGLPLNDAVYVMENAGYSVWVSSGRGSVRSQSVPPLEHLPRGSRVRLEMSMP